MRARAALVVLLAAASVSAQPAKKRPRTPPLTAPPATTFRAHVGADYALRLVRSDDPEERLRGIRRAGKLGTQEAINGLAAAVESPLIKNDSRALVETARALAPFADQERARAGLQHIMTAGAASRSSPSDEGDPLARAELARQIAALGLARSRETRAVELLVAAARGTSTGQNAALLALAAFPPREPGAFGAVGTTMPVPLVRLLGQIGDLRALEVLHNAARSTDASVRSAAIVAIAELGDERGIALARTAIAESDARLRAAAGEALVLLSAPERFKATSALLTDEATSAIGVRLAERVHDADIAKLLAARATSHPDYDLRLSAIRALGRSPVPDAATALVAPGVMADAKLSYFAMLALARSPAPNAGPLLAGLLQSRLKMLAARGYVVRALQRGERISAADEIVFGLARSSDARERAFGTFSRIVLDGADAKPLLLDKEARIRRAAAMGSLARPSADLHAALLAQLAREQDPVTRQVLAIGLLSGDREGRVTSTMLDARAESGGADAALAAFALAQRADEGHTRQVEKLLVSKDSVLRAHTARGLATATLPDATGRLADAYTFETDPEVRRAIVSALAARTADANAPARKATLEVAATLDPDAAVRQAARRAQSGAPSVFALPDMREAAWLSLTLDGGAPPGEAFVGSLLRADGLAVPLVFDEDGFAVVPGVPPGDARLVLAPRLPTYKPARP